MAQSEKVASSAPRRPLLIVVSAPSGAGKSTLCDRLVRERPDIVYSVSVTTRAPRGVEQNGVDYVFVTEREFGERAARGDFLEHAEVHGHSYGTLKATVRDALAAGRSVLMDIDVQGAAQVRTYARRAEGTDPIGRAFVDIFIEPPSMGELARRLRQRGTDSGGEIERRLRNAEEEMRGRTLYRYRIVNDDLETAYRAFLSCLQREWARLPE